MNVKSIQELIERFFSVVKNIFFDATRTRKMRKIFKDDNLQNSFLCKGYVRVPILSESQVLYILEELSKMHPDDNFTPGNPDSLNSPYGNTYHCSFLDSNLTYKRNVSILLKEIFTPFVNQYLVGYDILACNFYVKPSGTGKLPIHQNWPTISDINDTTVTIWCPLVDVNESNGSIQIVEGSHKILPHIEAPRSAAYFSNFTQALIDKYLKPVSMKAGESLIFDDALIHGSPNNNSEQPRIAIQIECIPSDATPVFFFKENEERFELIYADTEFYLKNHMSDLCSRQPYWKSIGYVKNQNRMITEEEFAKLLKNGDEIRSKIYY